MTSLSDSDVRNMRKMWAWYQNQLANSPPPRQPRAGRVPSGGGQLFKIGKTDSLITFGGNGVVSIYRNGIDTTENETAKLDWMHGDEDISSGKEVLIMRFADEGIWRIIGAECE